MGLASQPGLFSRKMNFILLSALTSLFLLLSFQLYCREIAYRNAIGSTSQASSSQNQNAQENLDGTTAQEGEQEDSLAASPSTTPERTWTNDPTKVGAIVAAARADQDLSWTEPLNDRWLIYAYNVDDPSPPPELWIPQAKGHEAIVYLSFIISNYDFLPPYTIFVHGHNSSWHQQSDLVTLVSNLRLPALYEDSYVPLRCDWYPSCPAEIRPVKHDAKSWGPGVHREDAELAIADAWTTLFPGERVPETIASQCCAQFAVTREAIRGRSREDYERMRRWLLNTELIDDISGRVLEKLWAYIMTKEAVRCPAPQQCACSYFGDCGKHDWPVPPHYLGKWSEE